MRTPTKTLLKNTIAGYKHYFIKSALTVGFVTLTIGCTLEERATSLQAREATETSYENNDFCPTVGWPEGLLSYLNTDATMNTNDTSTKPTPNCVFHQWSWETFVWANALDANGTPRFMSMATPADLHSDEYPQKLINKNATKTPMLTLASRDHNIGKLQSDIEGAGAIVEADGNMLIAKNGYPVYASVHMNKSYFNTAKNNLIIDGGYEKNTHDNFKVGAGVIKATWLRLGNGQLAPDGAFVMKAQVPVLQRTQNSAAVVPKKGIYEIVDVALVGMHVVGYTENHPEFLWGTFEHKDNSPMLADNTFTTDGSDDKDYTFYKAGTSFADVNLPNKSAANPVLTFDAEKGTFSPTTNVVLENITGGEKLEGVKNITVINLAAKSKLKMYASKNKEQAKFANYNLIGTVWMLPNTYNINSGAKDAIGSVTLANGTAETFFQVAKNKPLKDVKNCFSCHNASSYSFSNKHTKLIDRKIALSHILAEGSEYAVPNVIPVKTSVVKQ